MNMFTTSLRSNLTQDDLEDITGTESLTADTGTTEDTELNTQTITTPAVRSSVGFMTASLTQLQSIAAYGRSVTQLQNSARDLEMVTSFSQVVSEHGMSKPLASAFRATPGFDQTVANFPASDLYNIVPEHQSSAANSAGLEAFEVSTGNVSDIVKQHAVAMTSAFANVFANLATTADQLLIQVNADKAALEALDVSDDVISTLPVNALSATAFTTTLTKLGEQLSAVDKFDDTELRSDPTTIAQEVAGLESLVADIGPVMGLTVSGEGLVETDRSADYQPTQGTFGDKDITKDSLVLYLTQTASVLETMKALSDRADEITQSATDAANDMPTQVNSDDVTYGSVEHVTMLSCYTTLTTKLVQEAVLATSMVLQAVDAVLNVDDGGTTY